MTESPSKKNTAFEHAKRDLLAAIEQLRTEEGWQRWLTAKAHMPRYSWMNQIRVWVQDPEATLVRGKRQWQTDFNRSLEEWKPIWILAPMTKKLEDEEERRVFFRAVKVFDVRHTAPLPNEPEIPLHPPREPIEGESHEWALPGLAEHAATLGFAVDFRDLSHRAVGGWCDPEAKLVVVDDSRAPNAQVRTLVHELAHAHGITYREDGRSHAEACADAAAFLTCAAIGLDVAGESVPYIAGWHDAAEEVIESDLKRLQQIVNALSEAAGEPQNDETPVSSTGVPSEASERLTGAHHPVEA